MDGMTSVTPSPAAPPSDPLFLTTSMATNSPVAVPEALLLKRGRYADSEVAALLLAKEGKVDAFRTEVVDRAHLVLEMHKRESTETEQVLARLEAGTRTEQANLDRLRKRVAEARLVRPVRNQCEEQAQPVLALPSTQQLKQEIATAQAELTKATEALEAATLLSQAQEVAFVSFVENVKDFVADTSQLFEEE